jgi:hypothetical protein
VAELLFHTEFPKQCPDWLGGLELDMWSELLNLAFECDGDDHRRPIRRGGRSVSAAEKAYLELRERDCRKDERCCIHGTQLIRVPDNIARATTQEGVSELEDFIRGKVRKFEIEVPRKHSVTLEELDDYLLAHADSYREKIFLELESKKIELESPLRGMGDEHSFHCLVCGHRWSATLGNIVYEHYGRFLGCPKCSKLAKAQDYQLSLDERIDKEQILAWYESGEKTSEQITRQLGLGSRVIPGLLQEWGAQSPRSLEKKMADNKNDIIESFMGGERIHSISRRLKCNNNIITKVLQDWGVPMRSPVGTMWSAETKRIAGGKDHIIQLYKDGGTSRKIGAEYGVGSNVILKWLRFWGAEIKKSAPQVGHKHSEGAKRKMSVGHSKPWSAARREAENRSR